MNEHARHVVPAEWAGKAKITAQIYEDKYADMDHIAEQMADDTDDDDMDDLDDSDDDVGDDDDD